MDLVPSLARPFLYTTLSMAVDALDEAGALTFGSKEFFGRCPYIIKELPLLFMSGPRG